MGEGDADGDAVALDLDVLDEAEGDDVAGIAGILDAAEGGRGRLRRSGERTWLKPKLTSGHKASLPQATRCPATMNTTRDDDAQKTPRHF